MTTLNIVKIGGNVIDNPDALIKFLRTFASIPGSKILVHGGGKIATEVGNRMGIESIYNEGRRTTDQPTLDLVTMVYAGLINKTIVAKLQSMRCNAIGLSGADGNVIQASKRPVASIDYGYVGDIHGTGINTKTISSLIEAGLTPVFCAITHDGNGTLLNTNADTIANELAAAMATTTTTRLIYCFEKKGLLADIADETSVIRQITPANHAQLIETGTVSGGMIPKIENAMKAISNGVSSVAIGHADDLMQLIDGTAGTQITQ
ncbi:MAG: acetylglutamate kinase [Flavipsychrobacter sp.]|nr:acetylglutamate kinase [Flavipsychrobacter sp.]